MIFLVEIFCNGDLFAGNIFVGDIFTGDIRNAARAPPPPPPTGKRPKHNTVSFCSRSTRDGRKRVFRARVRGGTPTVGRGLDFRENNRSRTLSC